MADKPFVHLHLHTQYSLLDGATKLPELLEKCKELNMPAVAVTDHGNMYCAWKFYNMFAGSGVKPIIGCEFYMCEDHSKAVYENREYHHLILLAKNNEGYRNLSRLNSIAFVEGFYYKPRIDFELLKKYSEGLICLSACIAGQLPRLLMEYRLEEAEQLALKYKELFGDDYYIELQDHEIPEERLVMPQLIALARKLNIKLVVTNDVHYLNQEDAEAQDIMLCIQTGRYEDEPDRMRFHGDSFYLKTHDEMQALFPDIPEAITNTLEIAEKCNVTLGKEKLLPNYTPPDGFDSESYLKHLVSEGLKKKYPNPTDEIMERVNYELSVIISMGFVDYYLIVWDFINYAKSNGIPVGPGRGSGAGSVVAYLIGITEVEPFRYSLMFERFLNPKRKTMPDFDVDFCMDRRGEVIDYVHRKYGDDNVAQIVTFGTMAAKNSIKDVARVLRVSVAEANRLAKMVPDGFKYTLRHLLGLAKYKKPEDTYISEELKQAYNDPATHRVIDLAMRLEGSPRQTGMHAAGVVICSEKIADHVPLQTNGGALDKGGIVTTQYNMTEVEQAGLLKMDFLGLRTLTDIKKAIDYAKESQGVTIDFSQSNYDDPEVFKLISSGDTMCIFQLESGGMCDLMKRMQPDGLEDVIAGISLYRPGPMQYIPNYIEGKRDKSKITYTHPKMEPILAVTNGCIVYQEQVMQIVRSLAGFSAAMADNVRYAMSKKKVDMMKELGEYFVHGGTTSSGEVIAGCIANGISEETARKIYNELNDFSQYAFNKSHAACYAYVTYQTAYLKRYYPVELLCAMLNNRITNITDIKKYINYAKTQGIAVLPPDVNKSHENFTVEKGSLRFGLGAIKNVGVNAVAKLVEQRERGEFTSMQDLFERCSDVLNKRMVENLIKAGAFDCFNRTRADMMQWYQEELNDVIERNKKQATGQMSIFDMLPELKVSSSPQHEQVKEFNKDLLYSFEKEALGLYMSGSPLDDYDNLVEAFKLDFSTAETAPVEEEINGEIVMTVPKVELRSVTAAGIVHDIRIVKSKDNHMMAFGVLEDKFNTIEVALYGYDKYKNLFVEDALVVVKGTLAESRDAYKINIREVLDAKAATKKAVVQHKEESTTMLCLNMPEKNDEKLDKIYQVIADYPGELDVYLKMEGKRFMLNGKVRQCNGVKYELDRLLGEVNVVFFTRTTTKKN
ncbi:MAG TPA: DNA polymerase III subunit alpha [Candidatus Limihabitans stercoravium]|nr:DNA polymerase III subunit alpha [Candidatus Limihabitans stercoravium]